MRKLLIIALSVMAGEFSIAQESQEKELPLFAPKVSYLDSLKSTFVNHSTSSCIDERWMNELANSQLSKEMFYDIEHLNIDEKVNYDFDTELFKNRLKKLDARSPFVIEYNPTLENTIKAFLKNRSKSIERQMALAEYYFPMFEEHLAKYNLPLEIKYLAIVESALNPKAKSRVGAGGIWQFMPATGKQYKLDISSYVDERHDPLKATEAMCHYMTNMYAIFGDWSLVLASYNCGPGNVSKAIRRAGGSTDYWEIRKYLPKETANYVPAFLATMYIYEFKKEYGLVPQKASVTYFETDTVAVKKSMSFKQIAELLDVSIDELEFFNPTYSKNHIPSYEDEIYFLRLPKNKIGLFVSNEEKLYAYVDYLEKEKIRKSQLARLHKRDSIAKKDSAAVAVADLGDVEYEKVVEKRIKEVIKKDYHKVKKGETLSEIADQHNVSITELRKWNKIKGSNINFGQSLVIQSKKKVTVNEVVKKPVKKADVKTIDEETLVADNTSEKAQEKVSETKEVVATTTPKKDRIEIKEDFYIVQKGDSIFSITKKFPNLTVEDLKKKNNLPNNNIQPGMKLKIQG